MPDRLAQLTKLLALDPRDTFVLYALGQEHAKLGQHQDAIAFYDRCLAVNPDYGYAYFHKARSQAAAGDRPAARATVEAGIAAADRTGDAKAGNELAGLAVDLRQSV